MLLDQRAEPVEILRPSEAGREPIHTKAVIQKTQAFIRDLTVDVMRDDVIVRHLPNGNDQYLLVQGMTVHDHPRLGHIELRITETTRPRIASSGGADVIERLSDTQVESTWASRDLPVLQAVLILHEQDPDTPEVSPESVAAKTGLSWGQVQQALRALEAPPAHITGVQRRADSAAWLIGGVTALGRQRCGAWPDPTSMVERLISELQDMADHEQQPEKRSRARALLCAVGGASRDVAVEVLAAALSRATGMG